MNTTKECHACPLQDKCIYYYLSGHDFNTFPVLHVKRDIMPRLDYSPGEAMNLTLIHVGHTDIKHYLDLFFEHQTTVFQMPMQLLTHTVDTFKEPSAVQGTYTALTPFEFEDLDTQINYYNQIYQANFLINPKISPIKTRAFYDQRRYLIVSKKFKWQGSLGIFDVQNLDARLLILGVGKNNFLGGGHLRETQNIHENES